MSEVRSVTIGVWLSRGSRHEGDVESGIAHFVEHMLFKGTATRSAQAIAEEVDSIGGQLDAFTAKEYAAYYIRVLDEHLPIAVNILSDMILNPALAPVIGQYDITSLRLHRDPQFFQFIALPHRHALLVAEVKLSPWSQIEEGVSSSRRERAIFQRKLVGELGRRSAS